MRIDVHNHVIPGPALELLKRDPTYGVTIAGNRWHGGVHVEFEIVPSFTDPAAKLAELRDKSLDAAVVSVTPPLFYYHVDAQRGEAMCAAVNSGLAEFCAAAPENFRWLASVPMQAPKRAAEVLQHAAEAGAVGVQIGTAVDGRRLDQPEFDVFWAAAERLDLPVTLHPAYVEHYSALDDYYFENVLGFLFETTVAVERIICAGVLDRHPGLRLVLLHGGGYFPYHAGRLKHARQVRPELADSPVDPWAYLDRLTFDVITHDRGALEYLVSRVGAERVVMGTDLPFDMATPEPFSALQEAVGARKARAIAERNPAALYGLNGLSRR
jgi:aminocarboxymuconate-semialdehyde decarboxylase